MENRPIAARLIASYAREDAYLPLARVILARMGYAIIPAHEIDPVLEAEDRRAPDLRIVDERRMGEIPEDPAGSPVPMLVLTGSHGVTGADPRVAGAVKRPAGLHELYRLIQEVLEEKPRATPRVLTNLPARVCRRGREWHVSMLSLSENGCLVRTPEPIPLGGELDLSFDLPRVGTLEMHAESAYQLVPDLGLVFQDVPSASRRAILDFVTATLAVP